MPPRKSPDPRRDGNNNVRSEYRRPVSGYRERALAAGLPPEYADWHGGDASWYTEALFLMHEARASLSGWPLVDRLYELQDCIAMGLSEELISVSHELVPHAAQLMELRQQTLDHAEGLKPARRMRRFE